MWTAFDSNAKATVKSQLTAADAGWGMATTCFYTETGDFALSEASDSGYWTGELKTYSVVLYRPGPALNPLTVHLIKERNGEWYITRDSDFGLSSQDSSSPSQ